MKSVKNAKGEKDAARPRCAIRGESVRWKRAAKSAERKSYATHAERDETDRQAVIENTDNGERAQLAHDVRDTAEEMQVGRGTKGCRSGKRDLKVAQLAQGRQGIR